MFEEGNLLLFRPFIFKNGATPKDKFFLVLGKDIQGGLLLASLPTSKDHVPSDVEVKHGCLDMPRNLLSKQETSSWFLKQSNNIYHHNRVGGKRSSFLPTFVFRPLTPPYVRFRIRRFLFWIPFEIRIH